MGQRIRLWDKTGILIKELVSVSAYCDWVINDISTAIFTVLAPGMEPYIRYGNYVTIEHVNGLDTWVGIVVTPRPWGAGFITVTAKSPMWIFAQRSGSYEQNISGSFGEVMGFVLGIVNAIEPTLLIQGNYTSGISYTSTVDMSNVYTYVQRALAQAQTRMDFRPTLVKGRLAIYVDLSPTLYTASNMHLEEGLNIEKSSPILLEQGDIYNDITVIGVGLDQTKYIGKAFDAISIQLYQRRQFIFSEGSSQADVDRLATVRLAQYAYPRNTLGLSAIDLTYIKVGNSGPVNLFSAGYFANGIQTDIGFQGTAYLKMVQYDQKTAKAVLVCQEI
jgi:hypothetical protein